jgi:hypothetical protein
VDIIREVKPFIEICDGLNLFLRTQQQSEHLQAIETMNNCYDLRR